MRFRADQYDEAAACASAVMLLGAAWFLFWKPPVGLRPFRLISLFLFGQVFIVSGASVIRPINPDRVSFVAAGGAYSSAVLMMLAFYASAFVGLAVVSLASYRAENRQQIGQLSPRTALFLAMASATVSFASMRGTPLGILPTSLFGLDLVLPLVLADGYLRGRHHSIALALIILPQCVIAMLSGMLTNAIIPALATLMVHLYFARPLSRRTIAAAVAIVGLLFLFNPAKHQFRVQKAMEAEGTGFGYAYDSLSQAGHAVDVWLDSIGRAWAYGDTDELAANVGDSFERIEYNTLLVRVLSFVPETIPFQRGATYEGLLDIVKPRMFFPDKADLFDRKHHWAIEFGIISTDSTTTVVIPMVAEAYLDWGVPGIFTVPFAVGLLIGLMLLLAPKTELGQVTYVVLLTSTLVNLLDIMIWFLPGLIMLAFGGVLLRFYVRRSPSISPQASFSGA